jgi:precorrin-2 dehydrogenase/sirohydrochlorin ferrochelatase
LTRFPKHPIFLDLQGRLAVVVGGGPVAERKIAALIEAGAQVRVVSPRATRRIEEWAGSGRVGLERRRYRTGDLRGARVAYLATGDVEANREARQEADAEHVWLNVADEPALCDFFAPAVARRGHLTVAISTNGTSPVLAARLREKLQRDLGPEYADALEQLADLRARYRRDGRPLSEAREEIERLIDRALPPVK